MCRKGGRKKRKRAITLDNRGGTKTKNKKKLKMLDGRMRSQKGGTRRVG